MGAKFSRDIFGCVAVLVVGRPESFL